VARLSLDEDLGGFASRLQELGHDVVSALQPGRRGRTDAWHFRSALDDRRAILTWNRGDFEYWHRLWTALQTFGIATTSHAGILAAAPSGSFVPADWIPVVHARLGSEEPLEGRMWIWVASAGEWRAHKARPEV